MTEFPPDTIEVFHRRVDAAMARPMPSPATEDAPIVNWDTASASIRARLAPGEDPLPQSLLRVLRHPLEVAGKLGHGAPIAHSLFRTILDATNQETALAAWSDEAAWVDALEIARNCRDAGGADWHMDFPGSRGSVVAAALRRLADRGFDYQISPYRVTLTDDALVRACADIERAIQTRSGHVIVREIFASLQHKGAVYRGLFLYGRKTSGTLQPRPAQIPWHFLYNLAVKHLGRGTSNMTAQAWGEIVEVARDVAASLDVERYGQFEGIDINPYDLTNAVLDNTFYDELFSFQQWSTENAALLFDWWLDALSASGCPIPIASLNDWRAFGRALIAHARPFELTPVRASDLASPALPESVAGALMGAVAAGAVNAKYDTPLQTDERDAPLFPLFKADGGDYVVQPTGLAARALYEALYTSMRATSGGGDLERRLGDAMEHLAVRVLAAAGHKPSVAAAEYSHPTLGRSFEIDLVFESAGDLVLIECKRKALTRRARGASVSEALSDLSKGFIEPYIQMARHELALRKQVSLPLNNGAAIDLARRDVTRIALTMLDHGSLQNRVFIRAIVRVLAGLKLAHPNAQKNADLDRVNNKIVELWSLFSDLATCNGETVDKFIRKYEFGTWWLSVDQLSLVAHDASDIPAALAPLRHVTFQTGDLMNELAYAEQMRERAKGKA